jgi:hypothetical protein
MRAAGAAASAINAVSPFVAVWDFAPFGTSRRLGFRAVRDFAQSGIWRRSGRAPFRLRLL